MHEQSILPLVWQIDPACNRAGIGRTMMYKLIKQGEISPIRVGRRTLIPESELQKWLAHKMESE